MMRSSFSYSYICRQNQSLRKTIIVFASLVFISLICSPKAYPAQVTLAWDPPDTECNLSGYKIYHGESSRNYATVTDVKNVTIYTLDGLEEGKTYYFAATAYYIYGNESDYSEEISYEVPKANSAPVAHDGTLITSENTKASGNLSASDPDGDSLTFSLVEPAAKGSLIITDAETGSYTYTPNAGVSGQDSFTFKASDGTLDSNIATVSVTVTHVNHAPTASDGVLDVAVNTTAGGKLKAGDEDGDPLTYSIVTTPSKGQVEITDEASGLFTYEPAPDATGLDSFTFHVSDGKAASNVATVSVTIYPHVNIWLEAEDGYLASPMKVAGDTEASGGEYAFVPKRVRAAAFTAEQGYAEYVFDVPLEGEYVVFARVSSDSGAENGFLVSMDNAEHIAWNSARGPAKSWFWDKVSGASTSEPSSFYLQAGKHTLIFTQIKDGSKIDKILVTTRSDFLNETLYEDAEDGTIGGWDVSGTNRRNRPAAQILNVFDLDRQGNAIELSGPGNRNIYLMLSEDFTPWRNSTKFVMEWSLKYKKRYEVSIDVQTTSGIRSLVYLPRNKDQLGKGSVVRFGVGNKTLDGQWHRFVRDLQADLDKAQPGVRIEEVLSFSIRGSGRVDDIKLRPSL